MEKKGSGYFSPAREGFRPLFAGRPYRAFINVEVLVSLFIMVMVVGLALDAIFSYYQACWRQLDRQALLWAAQAQLQRCWAAAPIDSPPPSGMIEDTIKLTTTVEPGQGTWAGLKRVTVTASSVIPGGAWRTGPRKITEQISAYLPAEVQP